MDDEQRQRPNPTPSNHVADAPSTLESAESYVSRSKGTDCESHGSREAFKASFAALYDWGQAVGLIRYENEFHFFSRLPEGSGDEHEAWFDESCNRWFKATYPNKFGLAWGRLGSATAGEYLTRLVFQNQYFGDDIQLVAIVDSKQEMRVVTSQPHIPGTPAPAEEIRMWFQGLGFTRFECNGSAAWYRKPDNLLAADAHEGNVIKTTEGVLFAIDLNLIKPKGEMRAAVLGLLEPT
jgi:hypothetical protein